jgi:diguanylate cyclase (GGDEF)-like protein/PAS domain S-box-containing protein
MSKLKRDTPLRYGLAVLSVLLALVVTLLLWPQMQRTPLVLFFLAVVLSAWRGGAGPGLLATALAVVLSKLFHIAPGDPTLYGFWEDTLLRFVFLLNALLFVWLFASHRRSAEALRQSEERYRELFENANDLIYTHNLAGNFISLNKVGERITGYSREEATRLNVSEIVSPEHLEKAQQMIALKIKGREQATTVYESEIISKRGRRVPLELSTRVIYEGGKPVAIQGIARDITERKRTEETLRSLSLLDDLTGLYNRRGFLTLAEQQLRLAQRTGRGFALVFADLDGLKRINDTYGHQEGDHALIKTADILRQSFRDSDITARLSGDEFTILALEDYEGSPAAITARLMENLRDYNAQECRPYDLSLSIGVVHFNPESKCSIEELMGQADEAMYEHKHSKKTRRELYSEFVL